MINTWEEWFENCNSTTALCKKYEKLVDKFFKLQYSTNNKYSQQRQEEFEDRHSSKFYSKYSFIPKWKIINTLIYSILCVFVIDLVLIGLNFFKVLSKIFDVNDHTDLIQNILWSSKVSVECGIIFLILLILCYAIRKILLITKINKYNVLLQPYIKNIPPRYRNSTCTKYIYDMHKLHNAAYEEAITACDEYISSNNLIANYMSIMYDEPLEELQLESNKELLENDIPNSGLASISSNNSSTSTLEYNWDSVENIKVDIPNLPDDIKNHTFKGIPNPENYLNSMIGLNSIKNTIRQIKNRMSFYESEGSNKRISGNNMVFLGSPGTGKSTVARIMSSILSEFGYIKNDYCVEIDGNYLKSPYSGQSAEVTNAIMQYCEEIGACLFIDEAYTLLDSGDSGKESLAVLLQAMEQKKDSVVVVFAGYEDEINRLLASNPGFSSRIKYKLYFEDYSEEELIQIFKQMLTSYSTIYSIEDLAISKLYQQFSLEKQSPNFGNARVVRNALDRVLDIHADRFMKKEIQEDHKFVIEEQDINTYIDERKQQLDEDRRNFLANSELDSSIISMSDLKSHTKSGSKSPEKDLDRMIGLETIKNEIKQLKSKFEFYNGNIDNFGHCLFIGPPGTGKTTVASILTGYFYELGLISENRYFDCNGTFLQGSYAGHTGKRTEAICQFATGGVLFIDEAYSLVNSEGKISDYSSEAISVLIDFMEKNRNSLIVILAGYEKEMTDFINANSGIKSRIKNVFHFDNYSPFELANIINIYAFNDKFKVEVDCWEPIQYYLFDESKKPNFGNARTARNFWDKLKNQHIFNYSQGKYSEDKKYVITKLDVADVLKG